ncbi:hypothetical protein HFO04_01645 [Rhizobium laguerreae]|uniref:hypothetical protein n=1 Tax=Rhizobium laguerreae TaxID=1076926 RepID=UPI001C916734|nr:hypothetical protein [Rhizobium laguerreae]MBY3301512.1 hypothetical protein [Rhizobium laguerreae]
MNQIGKAKFAESWTGFEGSPPLLLTPTEVFGGTPSAELAKPNEQLAIDQLLKKHRPDFARPDPERGRFGAVVAPFTFEQWMEGIRLARESDRKSLDIRSRFAAVVDLVVERLRESRMKSALRPIKGGDFSVFLPSSVWNSERLDARFSLCQMNPLKPFDIGIAGDDYQLIFVDVVGLEALLKDESCAEQAAPSSSSSIEPWRRIIAVKKSSPHLTRSEISKQFAMSTREFDRHWKRAAEVMPELKKAGPPKKPPQPST